MRERHSLSKAPLGLRLATGLATSVDFETPNTVKHQRQHPQPLYHSSQKNRQSKVQNLIEQIAMWQEIEDQFEENFA